MRWVALFFIGINLYALEYKSNISYSSIYYNNAKNEHILSGDTKLKYEKEALSLNSTLEYFYSDEYKKRRYFDINELYFSYEMDNGTMSFGKMIKHWGELEGYNTADIFNKKRYINDPFNQDKKLGSYSFNGIYYFDDSSVEVGAKFYEEDFEYPHRDDPYYPFALDYSDDLQTSKSKYTPSIYLKYNFTTEDIESENSIILWHGYDSKREIILDNFILKQKAYRVNKLLYLSNFIHEDYIFKIESSLTDVKNSNLSDYAQITFGLEKSIYDIYGSDLGIYLEYYKYKYFSESLKNIDIAEVYNDDLFLALKLNFNDTDATELKTGILYDRKTHEKIFKTELSRRIADGLVLSGEVLNINAKEKSILKEFDNNTRAAIKLTYSF